MLREPKFLATLGPATDKPGVLEGLFKAGIGVVRMNFSHGSAFKITLTEPTLVRATQQKTGQTRRYSG